MLEFAEVTQEDLQKAVKTRVETHKSGNSAVPLFEILRKNTGFNVFVMAMIMADKETECMMELVAIGFILAQIVQARKDEQALGLLEKEKPCQQ